MPVEPIVVLPFDEGWLQRYRTAFRNGIAVGVVIGASLISIVWAVGSLSR